MGLQFPPEMGTWTWNGQSLIWPGGHPDDLEKMWSAAPFDGDDLRMPEVHGRLSRDWWAEEAVHEVTFRLSGLWMPNGAPAANVGAGIDANYAELCARVGSPRTWSGPDVATTVTTPSGRTLSGRAKGFVSPPGGRQGTVNFVTLTVVIPAGELAEVP